MDALREITKLSFLPLNPRGPDVTTDVLRNLSPNVQACVPDLLKVALNCADNVTDSDGTLRMLKSKVCPVVLIFYLHTAYTEWLGYNIQKEQWKFKFCNWNMVNDYIHALHTIFVT